MRVNQIFIKNSGPLRNLDINLSQFTLIVGDNERGKTSLLNWISRSLFEDPGRSPMGESWSNQINGAEDIRFDTQSFSPYYDGERMKNLLYVQEKDLLFKYKNPEEISTTEYWDSEINALLYGQDVLSEKLQQNFLNALGVGNTHKNSWLIQFHEQLFDFKNTLEDLLPEVESITGKEYELYKLSDNIGAMDKIEQEFDSEEGIYHIADKVTIGKKFLHCLETKKEQEEGEWEYQEFLKEQDHLKKELSLEEDKLLSLDEEKNEIKAKIALLQKKESELIANPYAGGNFSLGETVFYLMIGVTMLGIGVFLAFQSMGIAQFTLLKGTALMFFIIGIFFLVFTLLKGFYVQQLSLNDGENHSFFHQQSIDKAHKKYIRERDHLESLEKTQAQIQYQASQLKYQLKSQQIKEELLKKQVRTYQFLDKEWENLKEKAMSYFGTIDKEEVEEEVAQLEWSIKGKEITHQFDDFRKMRVQKNNLIEEKQSSSKNFERSKSRIFSTLKGVIDNIKNIPCQKTLEHFYPEFFNINSKPQSVSEFNNLIEEMETLITRVSKDRYRSETIVNAYQNLESQSETLLLRAMHTPFFEYLVQNIFGGKYKRFRAEIEKNKKIRIHAETGHGEFFPLESLSSASFAQFWFVLRLVLAKTILGNSPGVILLDDPFSTFDTIRKQSFIDLLNAFAHEGWQCILTITDDQGLYNNLKSTFGNILTVVDLNKDYN